MTIADLLTPSDVQDCVQGEDRLMQALDQQLAGKRRLSEMILEEREAWRPMPRGDGCKTSILPVVSDRA